MTKDILIAATVKNVPNGQIDLPQLEPDKVVSGGFNVAFFVAGALAVIMIIYAGIRFVTAHGDEKQVESARQTIIYSVVGLIVAILAYALVNWVFSQFKTN